MHVTYKRVWTHSWGTKGFEHTAGEPKGWKSTYLIKQKKTKQASPGAFPTLLFFRTTCPWNFHNRFCDFLFICEYLFSLLLFWQVLFPHRNMSIRPCCASCSIVVHTAPISQAQPPLVCVICFDRQPIVSVAPCFFIMSLTAQNINMNRSANRKCLKFNAGDYWCAKQQVHPNAPPKMFRSRCGWVHVFEECSDLVVVGAMSSKNVPISFQLD